MFDNGLTAVIEYKGCASVQLFFAEKNRCETGGYPQKFSGLRENFGGPSAVKHAVRRSERQKRLRHNRA